jgi:hypothetical protein
MKKTMVAVIVLGLAGNAMAGWGNNPGVDWTRYNSDKALIEARLQGLNWTNDIYATSTQRWDKAATDGANATNRVKAIENQEAFWGQGSTNGINASNTAWHVNGDNKPTASMNGGGRAFTNMASIRGLYGYYDIDGNFIYDRTGGVDHKVFDLHFRQAFSYLTDVKMFDWSTDGLVDFSTHEIRTTGYLTGKVKNGSATNDPVNLQQFTAGTNTLQGNINTVDTQVNNMTNGTSVFDLVQLKGSAGTNAFLKHLFHTDGTNYLSVYMSGGTTTNLYPIVW